MSYGSTFACQHYLDSTTPVRVLSRLFRRVFLEQLEQASATGQLQFSGTLAPLHEPQAFAAYRRHSAIGSGSSMRRNPLAVRNACSTTWGATPIGSRSPITVCSVWTTIRSPFAGRTTASTTSKNSCHSLLPSSFAGFYCTSYPVAFNASVIFGFLGNRYRQAKLDLCRHLLAMTPSPSVLPARVDYRDRYEQLTGKSLRVCPVRLRARWSVWRRCRLVPDVGARLG